MRKSVIRAGISGWRYEPWRGEFYPKGLVQKKELHYASRQLRTIEINGSFYALQSPKSYRAWHDDTPDDFMFSVKGPRYVTHIKRLKAVEAPLGNFFGSGVLHLRDKLGPFLWQLPPNFLFDEERLASFFAQLPRTVGEAVTCAGQADRLEPDFPDDARASSRPLRHALEVRHHSFENPYFIELLVRHNISLVFADTAGKWPYMEDVTSNFIYLRLHGEAALYRSGYGEPALNFWATRIRAWSNGTAVPESNDLTDRAPDGQPRDVFVHFDNDIKVHAPHDAHRLTQILKL